MAKIHEGIGELKFTEADIDKMEAVARTRGEDQYLMLRLWGRRGLRVSEPLGLHKSDIDSKGIWITQKGGERVLKILPPEVYSELTNYSKKFGKTDLLFPITRRTAQNWAQSIAKEAGIVNWERAHPHRWRHFFRNIPSQENGKGPLEGDESHGSQGPPSVSGVREQSKPRGGIGGIVKLNERLRRIQVRHWFSSRNYLRSPIPVVRSSIDSGTDKNGVPQVKHRRFWILGVLAFALFYHAYGILTGVYQDLTIVSYDTAVLIGVLEALLVPFLSLIFLWKSVVWWHGWRETHWETKHVFDDQNILD